MNYVAILSNKIPVLILSLKQQRTHPRIRVVIPKEITIHQISLIAPNTIKPIKITKSRMIMVYIIHAGNFFIRNKYAMDSINESPNIPMIIPPNFFIVYENSSRPDVLCSN